MTGPDRVLLQVQSGKGETELEMLYSLDADRFPQNANLLPTPAATHPGRHRQSPPDCGQNPAQSGY